MESAASAGLPTERKTRGADATPLAGYTLESFSGPPFEAPLMTPESHRRDRDTHVC